jgi:hypothetical protein
MSEISQLYRGRNQYSYSKTPTEDIHAPDPNQEIMNQPRLKLVQLNELYLLIDELNALKTKVDQRIFKYEIMICFWLAIDQKKF